MLASRCRARRCLAALSLALLWPVAQAAAQPAPSGALLRIDAQVPASYQEPAVAAGPDGGFTVAWSEGWWQEPAGGYGQSYVLRVRRFDPAGKPRGPAFRIAQAARYGLGDGTRFEFDVAAGGDGSALVVWSFDAATSPLYGRLLDATGRPLGNAFLLAHRPGLRRARVVPDRRGGYLVVWSQGTALVSRRVRAAGASPGPRFEVAASSRFVPRSLGALAVGPRGDLAVAWAQRPWDDDEPALFLQRFDSAWRPLSGEIRVESPLGWRSLPWEVSLAFGADGELAILWTAEPAASGDRLVLARRFTAAGRWAGPPARIAEGSDVASGSTALAADPGGGYLAIWHRLASSGAPATGFARRLEPSGSLGHVFPLDPEDLGRRGGVPKVVAVGKGRFAAVWAGAHGILGQRFVSDAPGRLELRLRRAVAAEGSGEARLEVVRRDGCRGEVGVSYSAGGLEAAPGEDFDDAAGKVTFADGDSLPKSIVIPVSDDDRPEADEAFRVVLHDPEGGASLGPTASAEVEIRDDDTPSPVLAGAGPEIPVTSVPYPGQGFYLCCSDVAPRSAGGFVVAWEEGTLRRPPADYWSSVGFSLFDGDGGWAGDGGAGGGEEERAPRLLPRPDGGFVLLWADEEFRGGATGRSGRVFDATGEPMGEAFPLAAFAPVGEDTIPLRAAPRPDGGFVAVGLLRSGTSFQLFAERHGGDGRRLGEAIPVNERPILDQDRERQGFAVASDAAGGFVVVWKRTPHPGHPGGVFARRFAASGAPRGGEIRVGGQVGMVDDPKVAAAPGGAFVVLWSSDRGGHGWTVSARWFDRTGKPLGAEVLVPSAGGGGSPLAAFGPGGKLLVLWGSEGQLYAGPALREGSQFTLTDDPFGGAGALAATGAGWTAVYGFLDLAREKAGLLARTLVP